jgi:hypothetical protein
LAFIRGWFFAGEAGFFKLPSNQIKNKWLYVLNFQGILRSPLFPSFPSVQK